MNFEFFLLYFNCLGICYANLPLFQNPDRSQKVEEGTAMERVNSDDRLLLEETSRCPFDGAMKPLCSLYHPYLQDNARHTAAVFTERHNNKKLINPKLNKTIPSYRKE